jgi:hypothetical protein
VRRLFGSRGIHPGIHPCGFQGQCIARKKGSGARALTAAPVFPSVRALADHGALARSTYHANMIAGVFCRRAGRRRAYRAYRPSGNSHKDRGGAIATVQRSWCSRARADRLAGLGWEDVICAACVFDRRRPSLSNCLQIPAPLPASPPTTTPSSTLRIMMLATHRDFVDNIAVRVHWNSY